MDPIILRHTGDIGAIPTIYKTSVVIPEEDEPTSSISCVEVHGSNLYVGTESGSLRHFHLFEDATEYMLISEIPVSTAKKPIKKLLILPGIERVLVLCGSVVSVFSLPELSPVNIGKLKDVNDMHATSSTGGTADIIVFTSSKIRIVQVTRDLLKLVSDLNYSNTKSGVPIPPSASTSTTAAGGLLAIVANNKNYDIIDLKQIRKIPLFEYTQDTNSTVLPHIVSCNGEYMLTIKSDDSSSIAMFIDGGGNVTRGTLSWMDAGYPGSIIIDWPYVLGIFQSDRLIISSIESFEVEHDKRINEIQEEEEVVMKNDGENTEVEGNKENSDREKEEKVEKEEIVKVGTLGQNDDLKKDRLNVTISKLTYPMKIIDKDLQSSLIVVDTQGMPTAGNSSASELPPMIESIQLIFTESQVWMLHKENVINYVGTKMKEILQNGDHALIPQLLVDLNLDKAKYNASLTQYKLQLIFLLTLLTNYSDDSIIETMLSRDHKGKLILDPKFFLHSLDDENDVFLFSGIHDILELQKIDKSKYQNLLIKYIRKLYTEFVTKDKGGLEFDATLISKLRLKLYRNDKTLTSSNQLIEYIDTTDLKMFNNLEQDSCNKEIRSLLTKRSNYLTLIHLYKLSVDDLKPTAKSIIAEEICRLILKLQNGEIKDNDYNHGKDFVKLLDTLLSQLGSIYNEKVYTTYLLEVLKIDPERGLKYMKENNSSAKYKSIHKHILDEISSHVSTMGTSTSTLSALKIEYLESMINSESVHDPSSIDDLLLELCQRASSPDLNNQSNINNFMVLQETYKIETLLEDPIWPKITWIDYLKVNMQRSECKEFATNYLKVVELLLIRKEIGVINTDDIHLSTLIKSDPMVYNFYSIILAPEVQTILEINDYSSSEYFAIHGYLPFPREPYYFGVDTRTKLQPSTEKIKKNLTAIFDYYSLDKKNMSCIRHFITAYGSEYFNTLEILSMIPSYIPVMQIQEYLTNCLIELGANHRNALLTKIVSRSNEKEMKQFVKEVKLSNCKFNQID